MSHEESGPIQSLPDEVLCYMFSFITKIPTKMTLELVCKRFRFLSTTNPSSWSANDTLAINAGCYTDETSKPTINYFGDRCKLITSPPRCPYPFHLNGHNIPVENWPQATAQLLERTIIHKLCLHIDDRKIFVGEDSIRTILQSFPIVKNNANRIKLNYLEFHRRPGRGNDKHYIGDWMFLWAVEQSQKTLEKIVLVSEHDASVAISKECFSPLCSAIKKCIKLKSFVIHHPRVRNPLAEVVDALEGKPLTELTIAIPDTNPYPVEESVLAACAASSCGIKTLTVKADFQAFGNLTMFYNSLDGRCRETLEQIYIRIADINATINFYLSHLDNLPDLFPNLKHLHLDLPTSNSPLNEDLLLNTDFFKNCIQKRPNVDLKVLISSVPVYIVHQFKQRLIASCEVNGISAEFSEGESWFEKAILSKGNATIELQNVHEDSFEWGSDDEDSSSDDSDDDWDMDDDYFIGDSSESDEDMKQDD